MRQHVKLHGSFINRHIKPTIGTPVFLSICDAVMSLIPRKYRYYGDAIFKIHERYKSCTWLPIFIFKLGYAQAFIDSKQDITFDFTCSDKKIIDRTMQALNVSVKGGASI